MIVSVFVLFVMYTLACVADGPDVKPKWKFWLGCRLEKEALKYKPIAYCMGTHKCPAVFYYRSALADSERMADYHKSLVESIVERQSRYEALRVDNVFYMAERECFVSEGDVHDAMIMFRGNEFAVKERVDELLAHAADVCRNEILEPIKQQIKFDVDRKTRYPGIIVKGTLILRKNV